MHACDWSAARAAMMLDPTIINLNTGSFGPTPRVVYEKADEYRRQLAAEPTDFFVRRVPPLLWEARRRLGEYLNIAPNRLVFTTNVSTAINMVAAGLTLSRPGEILLTDHEYGAMHWCWERAAQRLGLTLRTFALPTMTDDPQAIVEAAARAITPRTRLFFFSHILSPTGLILPARELCALARARGVLSVVDGAHAPLMVPLDLQAIGADFYAGNLHKWLLAAIGSGFLAIGPGNEDRLLQSLEVSWGYHHRRDRLDEPDEFGSTPRMRFLEFTGTRDLSPWLAVPTAIDFVRSLEESAIRRRMHDLSAHARRRLHDEIGLPPATPTNPNLHGAMTAFELPAGLHAHALREAIWRHRIEVPIVERPERLLIRISSHFYTTEAEIDRLAEVLPAILGRA